MSVQTADLQTLEEIRSLRTLLKQPQVKTSLALVLIKVARKGFKLDPESLYFHCRNCLPRFFNLTPVRIGSLIHKEIGPILTLISWIDKSG
jgi:hypothetical protein